MFWVVVNAKGAINNRTGVRHLSATDPTSQPALCLGNHDLFSDLNWLGHVGFDDLNWFGNVCCSRNF